MKDNDIVVAIGGTREASFVLDKAATLAAERDATVHVVRVIYEDLVEHGHLEPEKQQELKLYLMQAEEEFLQDLVAEHEDKFRRLDSTTLWNKRVSEAVLDMAKSVEADLVIKATDVHPAHFPRHPDDWNLLRHAVCPVLLVKPQAWPSSPKVLAAIDAFDTAHGDMNGRILDDANWLCGAFDGEVHIVNAYPRLDRWATDVNAGVDFPRMEEEIRSELSNSVLALAREQDIEAPEIHLDMGPAANVVADCAERLQASVIVMGTAGREGVSAFVIGNTSETILNLVETDLLVLHV